MEKMASPVAKIIMKNTTKISLNERFTVYRQQTQNTVSVFRQKLHAQRQASVENRRLAQQMANRPTVIAALRLKKRSLQQRLGNRRKSLQSGNASVKSRLDFSVKPKMSNFQGRVSTFRSNRGRGSSFNRRGRFQGYRGNNFSRSGNSPMIKARLGAPSDGSAFSSQKSRGSFGLRRNFGRGANRGRNQNMRSSGASPRRGSSGRGRGRASSAGRSRQPIPTKQELDNQLDEYMAETKTPMDKFLNHY